MEINSFESKRIELSELESKDIVDTYKEVRALGDYVCMHQKI